MRDFLPGLLDCKQTGCAAGITVPTEGYDHASYLFRCGEAVPNIPPAFRSYLAGPVTTRRFVFLRT